MGFLYSPSCVAGYKLTGNETGRKAAILAADQLIRRFHPVGNFIQAWGAMDAPENYRLIIDCLLNLPLLYWASEETGDPKYRDIAEKHIHTAVANVIREDHSTWHTFFFDMKTGAPDHGATCRGYRDGSAWARGRAWGIYGMALAYKYTEREEYIQKFRDVTDFFLAHLPKDMVPFWDLEFTDGDDQPRDSSSASIAACGMLEMAKYLKPDEAEAYRATAKRLMKALYDGYAVKDPKESNGLVLHSTYSNHSPYNTCNHYGVDECNIWGRLLLHGSAHAAEKRLESVLVTREKGRYGRMKREAFLTGMHHTITVRMEKRSGRTAGSNFQKMSRRRLRWRTVCAENIFCSTPSGIWSRPTSRYSLTERSTGRICRQTIRNLSGSSTDTAFFMTLGRAYQMTGDEKYARAFMEIAEDWIDHVPLNEKYAAGPWRSLDTGFRGEYWSKAIWLFHDSPTLTEAFLQKYYDSMILQAEHIMECHSAYRYMSNWGVIENHGLFEIGVCLPQSEKTKQFIAFAVKNLEVQVRMQIMPDGVHWEQSPMYHNEVLHCLLDVILLAKRNDIALPDVILRQTEKMAMADVAWLKPDHHIVMMGDSDDVDVRDRISVAAYLFLNPVLRFGGFDRLDYESIWDLGMKAGEEYAGMERRKPDFTSLFLEHSGNTYFRSDWSERANFLHLHSGTMGAGHGHSDKLHIDLVVNGEDVLMDGGRYTYVSGPKRFFVQGSVGTQYDHGG